MVLTAACTTEARKTKAELTKEDRVRILLHRHRCSEVVMLTGRILTPRCVFVAESLCDCVALWLRCRWSREIGISEFQVWHHAGQGVPDPDVKRMGFFITTSEAQTLLEFDLSQVLRVAARR